VDGRAQLVSCRLVASPAAYTPAVGVLLGGDDDLAERVQFQAELPGEVVVRLVRRTV